VIKNDCVQIIPSLYLTSRIFSSYGYPIIRKNAVDFTKILGNVIGNADKNDENK
jgi:hypothetical protein